MGPLYLFISKVNLADLVFNHLHVLPRQYFSKNVGLSMFRALFVYQALLSILFNLFSCHLLFYMFAITIYCICVSLQINHWHWQLFPDVFGVFVFTQQPISTTTSLSVTYLILKAPIATKCVCFSRKALCQTVWTLIRLLYKQSILSFYCLLLYLNSSFMFGNYLQQTTLADDISDAFFSWRFKMWLKHLPQI